MPVASRHCPVRAVTHGPQHHFFGYYDKSPWDPSGRYMLAMQVGFMERPPTPDDRAIIGLVSPDDGRFRPLAETTAWNWQQACMLQWLPSAPDHQIVYNDRVSGQFVATILDAQTGARRTLPRPIYTISRDGQWALTLNFSRLARTRPGYGYVGVPDPWECVAAPEDDGIYRMSLATGECELIVSLAQVARLRHHPTMDGATHWFNHLLVSPDDLRFIFLHRWGIAGGAWATQMFTARADGADICCLADDGMVSHFDWRDPRHVLAWARHKNLGDHYFLYSDCSDRFELLGADVLLTDGHCSYSPDLRWVLTDTYPDSEHRRALLLYEPATGRRLDIGRFYAPPELAGELRCDLHPRWSRDGQQVCIDSVHEGTRQIYVIDVAEAVSA